jgi:hypothetical protein
MHPGSHVLWGCSAPTAILPRSFQLCKTVGRQLYLQSEKQWKVRWVRWGNRYVDLGKNSLVRKEVWDGALSWCNSHFFVKVRNGVFAYFYAVAVKCHISNRNWLFDLSRRIFMNNPLDVKENCKHALDYALHLSRLFRSRWFGLSVSGSCFLSRTFAWSLPGSP